ncbi:PQQ-binding-like beta-propeller repeat protein, partial [bacterium]|nr:PQQ-binding-like beta-propeller repeat protein [bacterium]
AYLGAGIFPAEGVYLYAVDARTGKMLWCNDSCADAPQSRISPQGYLLASETTLFATMGRVTPAGFNREDGRLLHETYFTHNVGGTYALLVGNQMFTGTSELVAYDKTSRSRIAWYHGRQIIVTPDTTYLASGRELIALDRKTYPKVSLHRKGLLDRKTRLNGSWRGAMRIVQQRQAVVKQSQKALAALDARIAALTQQKKPVPGERQVQRDNAAKKLAADQKTLAAAQNNRSIKQMADLNTQIKKADDAIEKATRWRCATPCADSLILAGNTLVAGGQDEVVTVNIADGKPLWTAKVKGLARGLAVADGHLYVSTNTGAITRFGPQGSKNLGVVKPPVDATPFPADAMTPLYEAAAKHILQTTGAKNGYCLVLGTETGRLAYELAQRTDLVIYAVDPDAAKVAAARKALDAAGLYGTRVFVDVADPAAVPYSDYFANLIVSETALVKGTLPGTAAEAFRMLKPIGGALCIGQPTAAKGKTPPLSISALRQWAATPTLKGAEATEHAGPWLTFVRGPLPGAGGWTHQYAEPGNTTCSDETLLECPLGLLWFGDPGPGKMAERHRRPAAPLAINGRLFIQGEGTENRIGAGENSIMAYDAYNGVKLWERGVRGALRTTISHDGGNSAVNADSFFIAAGDTCLRLDAATGKTKATYPVPPPQDGKARRWGYVALVGDRLYGSRSAGGRAGDCVFCIDLATGKLAWKYEANRIPQGTIAIGNGTLFLARTNVSTQERQQALKGQIEAMKKLTGAERKAAEAKLKAAAVRVIVALDAATGKTKWEQPMELTGSTGGAYWCS